MYTDKNCRKGEGRRRKAIKSILTFAAVLFTAGILAIGSCCFYAFKIEPYRIERKEYFLKEKEEEMLGIKLVQFSDVHIKEGFTGENLEAVVEKINEQNPVRVVGEVTDWSRLPEEVIARIRSRMEEAARAGIEAINE